MCLGQHYGAHPCFALFVTAEFLGIVSSLLAKVLDSSSKTENWLKYQLAGMLG